MANSGAASANVAATFYMQTAQRRRVTRDFLNAVREPIGACRAPMLAVSPQASKIHKDCPSDLDAGCNWSKYRGKRRSQLQSRSAFASVSQPLAIVVLPGGGFNKWLSLSLSLVGSAKL